MDNRILLEISVQTVEAAAAAERGGANRIELCANLAAGGITPGVELMRRARKEVRIPIFVMIRPRAGDFVYVDDELAQMRRAIAAARELSLDGVVLGILTPERRVNIKQTRALVEFARPLPVTFHRAFDELNDLTQGLEDVIQTGAARILTSGGAPTALAGAQVLARLVAAAAARIVIMPGAAINASNIAQIARQTRAKEFHSGLSSQIPYSDKNYAKFEAEVRNLASNLREAASKSAKS